MSGKRHKKELWLDPRAKLFLILMCVLSSMFAPSLAYLFILVMLIADVMITAANMAIRMPVFAVACWWRAVQKQKTQQPVLYPVLSRWHWFIYRVLC